MMHKMFRFVAECVPALSYQHQLEKLRLLTRHVPALFKFIHDLKIIEIISQLCKAERRYLLLRLKEGCKLFEPSGTSLNQTIGVRSQSIDTLPVAELV